MKHSTKVKLTECLVAFLFGLVLLIAPFLVG